MGLRKNKATPDQYWIIKIRLKKARRNLENKKTRGKSALSIFSFLTARLKVFKTRTRPGYLKHYSVVVRKPTSQHSPNRQWICGITKIMSWRLSPAQKLTLKTKQHYKKPKLN